MLWPICWLRQEVFDASARRLFPPAGGISQLPRQVTAPLVSTFLSYVPSR